MALLDPYNPDEFERLRRGPPVGYPEPPVPGAAPIPQLAPPGPAVPSLVRAPQNGAAAPLQTAAPGGGMTPPPPSPNQQELTHLTAPGTQGAKTGIQKLPMAARIPLTVLDAVGSTFLPGLMMGLPGTQLHHNMLVRGAERNVGDEQAAQAAESKRQLEAAQTGEATARGQEAASMPELHQTQAELAARKEADAVANQTETSEHHKAQIASQLAQHGFKLDEQGNVVPLPYEEMSQDQQAVHDLRASQQEVQEATAALRKAQKDNIPKAAELARKRLDTARENAATASRRLGLSEREYEVNYHGTENGQPIPGAPADESGNPIGVKTAVLSKPGTMAQSRGTQGGIIVEQGDNMIKAINEHRDKIGNIGSYWNSFVNSTPIADPDASKLMAQLGSFAALQPSLHGFRSQQALKEFEKLIGGVPKDPDSLIAAIKGIQETASVVKKHGTMNTVKPQGTTAPTGNDAKLKAYADQFFGGDVAKAQTHIDQQRKK